MLIEILLDKLLEPSLSLAPAESCSWGSRCPCSRPGSGTSQPHNLGLGSSETETRQTLWESLWNGKVKNTERGRIAEMAVISSSRIWEGEHKHGKAQNLKGANAWGLAGMAGGDGAGGTQQLSHPRELQGTPLTCLTGARVPKTGPACSAKVVSTPSAWIPASCCRGEPGNGCFTL